MISWPKVLAIVLVAYTTVVMAYLLFWYEAHLPGEDIFFIPAVSGTVIGAFLTIKRPENRMGPLMAVMAASLVTLGASTALVPWSLEQGSDALTTASVHLSDMARIAQFVTSLVLLPLWLPAGRPFDARSAWVGRIGIVAAALAAVSAFVLSYLDISTLVSNVSFAIGLIAVWASIAAVLKYRLYDIDRIISRTVANAIVIGVLAAIYVGLVIAISSQSEGSLSVATSTLAVAALFNPLRRRVQGWVDRRFNRSAYDIEQVMGEFVGSQRGEVDAVEVVGGWVDVGEETMQPSSVGVWVRR